MAILQDYGEGMRWFILILVLLPGCDRVSDRFGSDATAPPDTNDITTVQSVAPEGRDDTVQAAEPTTAQGLLGRTVASLGDATEPGLWLKTPLVVVPGPGRVRDPASGNSTQVTLIPIEGPVTAGSRLSLAAMQALRVSLTDLLEVEVIAEG